MVSGATWIATRYGVDRELLVDLVTGTPRRLLGNHEVRDHRAGDHRDGNLAMRTTTEDEERTCERCDAEIPPARAKALPGTWLCIECSREVGGDFVLIANQENPARPAV